MDVPEVQALLDACSSMQEWELLIESVLIPEKWHGSQWHMFGY